MRGDLSTWRCIKGPLIYHEPVDCYDLLLPRLQPAQWESTHNEHLRTRLTWSPQCGPRICKWRSKWWWLSLSLSLQYWWWWWWCGDWIRCGASKVSVAMFLFARIQHRTIERSDELDDERMVLQIFNRLSWVIIIQYAYGRRADPWSQEWSVSIWHISGSHVAMSKTIF